MVGKISDHSIFSEYALVEMSIRFFFFFMLFSKARLTALSRPISVLDKAFALDEKAGENPSQRETAKMTVARRRDRLLC
jgi:hypothetical protein